MKPLLFARNPALTAGLAILLLTLAPSATRADIVLGNLGAGDGGNVSTSTNNFNAASFTMGSQDYLLSDVQIRITGNGNAGATFQLRADASGHPSSSALFTFTNETITGFSTNTVTFPAGSPFTLTANSTYWLVGFTTNGNINWVDSSPHTNPSGSGATFGQYQQSNNSGATWASSLNEPKFQLDGTPLAAIPEPSSLLLVGTVACVASAVGWRRRRTRQSEPDVVTPRSPNGT